MRPTRLSVLLAVVVVTGLLGWLLTREAYEHLEMPSYAPVTAALMAVFELGLARTVSQKVRGRSTGKPMHPLQVARAAALAKASSAGGAALVGFYGGYFVWAFDARDRLRTASHDALLSGLTAGTCLALVVAALLLERACRTPETPDEVDEWQS